MKLQDINFRIWLESDKRYITLNAEVDFPHEYGIMKSNKGEMYVIYKCNGEVDKFSSAEVELFTEFKDKNGNEIYEGDIIKCWNDNYYEDKDDPYAFGSIVIPLTEDEKKYDFFTIRFDKELGFTCDNLFTLSYIIINYDCVEVVGNIRENPELLD